MRKPFIGANWKMNRLGGQSTEFLERLSAYAKVQPEKEIIVFPSMPYLSLLSQNFSDFLGAQNVCHTAGFAALTGETSVVQLKDLGIKYGIVGHSERRFSFYENDDIVLQKATNMLNENLGLVFCCGESMEVRKEGSHLGWIESQLQGLLKSIKPAAAKNLVIAYEPLWSIGTGIIPSLQEIEAMHLHLRSLLHHAFGEEAASDVRILYGGSCNEKNAKDIFSLPNVDGGLIGGASLDWNTFVTICDAL
ncbi:MAG: triose-phosphate isomerase [Flavobacteriales bacterium]